MKPWIHFFCTLVVRNKSFHSFFSRETERDLSIENRPIVTLWGRFSIGKSRPFNAEKCSKHFCYGLLVLTTSLFSASPTLVQAKALAVAVAEKSSSCPGVAERADKLFEGEEPARVMTRFPEVQKFLASAQPEERFVFSVMIALNQADTLFDGMNTLQDPQGALKKLAQTLVTLEHFYQPIGGVLGYHTTVLNLLTEEKRLDTHEYSPPPVQDIRTADRIMWNSCYWGTAHLGSAGMIFALGGAGDRLNLLDPSTGEPLPAACFSFCGRSFFEGMMRDVEAQEYWHYLVFGTQVTMPVLIMTSLEKNNDHHIEEMCRKANWFGRPSSSIRRIVQPLVPVIDTDGQWIVSAPLDLALKPGGHGVIWKLAQDTGAAAWLRFHGIDTGVVRQVNNPFAGLDQNLLALFGYGNANNKSFGFLSCPSRPGLAEGLDVLSVSKEEAVTLATITNIEYTQFAELKNQRPDLLVEGACPANTNILYVRLRDIPAALAKNPIPGMIVNPKTVVEVMRNGQTIKKVGGRLESCMQNIADGFFAPINAKTLPTPPSAELSTFLVLQDRGKLLSPTKRAYVEGQPLAETSFGSLYDWHCAMRSLLAGSCHMTVPQEATPEEFVHTGPSFVFSFHPAMGPLWTVIGQKLSAGTISQGSELELEIAEIACTNLNLNGSLRVLAHVPTGPTIGEKGRQYTDKVGRANFSNVNVVNKGLKSRAPLEVLNGTLQRHETCEIILEGFSEVVAENLTINGPFHLVVPDGKRAVLHQDGSGAITTTLEAITAPSWHYTVEWKCGVAPVLKVAS
jgi:hypothetical protein